MACAWIVCFRSNYRHQPRERALDVPPNGNAARRNEGPDPDLRKPERLIADSHERPEPGDAPSILSKAFELLRAFNPNQRIMTLSELARASSLPKSTVHRLLARLIELDAIEPHRGAYKLSVGLLQFGANTPASAMRDLALQSMTSLRHWTGRTVELAVLREFDVVYLDRLGGPSRKPKLVGPGGRLPAHCTAIGKALLAWEDLDDLGAFLPPRLTQLTAASIANVDQLVTELRKIRADGIAYEHGEAQPDVFCSAAPIVVNGFAIGAISVEHSDDHQSEATLETALREATSRVARSVRRGLEDPKRANWFPHDL